MANSEHLHPSDLCHAILVYHMIQVSRDEKTTESKLYLRDIFYYIVNIMAIPRMKIFRSLKAMLQHLRSVFKAEYVDEAVEKIHIYFKEFTNLDTLITFMEDLKTVFEIDSQATQNNLIVPNQVSNKSVLGIFLRKIIASWESMMFEEHCEFYDSLTTFLRCDEVMDIDQENSVDAVVTSSGSAMVPIPPLVDYIRSIEELLQSGNIAETEHTIHNYFDRISSNPLFINFVSEEGKSIAKQLQELKELEAGRGLAGSWLRHQHAMMNLAIMWISAKNYEMAQSAVEEALKTAHQRGDHPSVVKCLLLLFQVLQSYGDSQEGSSDELLIRCISKSGVLGLNDLVNEAVLLFAKTKMRNLDLSVIATDENANTTDDSKAKLATSSSPEWTFQHIFNLLSFAVHGEMSLTVKYCLTRVVTNLDDINAVGVGVAAIPTAKQSTVPSEKINFLDEKYAELYFNAALIYAELWHRGGRSHMSSIFCRRAIDLFGRFVKDGLFMAVVSKLVFSMVNELFQDYHSKYDKELNVLQSLKESYEVYSKLKGGLTSPIGTEMVVDVTSNYLYAFLSLSQGDWQRAFRFSQKIINIIDSNSSSIPGQEKGSDDRYDDSLMMMEDKLRCKALHLVLTAKTAGIEKDSLVEQIKILLNKHNCTYILDEDSIQWVLQLLYPVL